MFPTTRATRASLGEPTTEVTGTQGLLEVHLLVASLQGQLGFQG